MIPDTNLRRRPREIHPEVLSHAQSSVRPESSTVEIGLNAAIAAVIDDEPVALVVRDETEEPGSADGLPSGPFSPVDHRTLESGLRATIDILRSCLISHALGNILTGRKRHKPEKSK